MCHRAHRRGCFAPFPMLTISRGMHAPLVPMQGMNYREDSKFVWASNTYLQNAKSNGLSNAGTPGLNTVKGQTAYTMANGLLMAQYLILVFDVPGHMAEETKNASKAVPRSIMTTYLLGSAFNFALLLAYLYGITHINNVTVPGFGITGSCNTNNGDLVPWSTQTITSEGVALPNNGIPLNKFKGGCILSNGYPFSYFTVGNIFYDAFASVRCALRAVWGRCGPE
jgi:amino acid transporter